MFFLYSAFRVEVRSADFDEAGASVSILLNIEPNPRSLDWNCALFYSFVSILIAFLHFKPTRARFSARKSFLQGYRSVHVGWAWVDVRDH